MLKVATTIYGITQGANFVPGAAGAGAIIGCLAGRGLAPIASTAVATTCDVLQASSIITAAGAGGAVQGICSIAGSSATVAGGSAAKASVVAADCAAAAECAAAAAAECAATAAAVGNLANASVVATAEGGELLTALGALGAGAGAQAGAKGAQAVAGATKAVVSTGKAVFNGVAGGLGVVAGGVEMGFAIAQLVNGSPTQNQMKEMLDVVKKTQEVGHLMPKKKAAVDRAVEELEELYAAITEYVEAINGTKIGGATTSAVGGGLCIAGIFFPPLLVPGLIVGGVGAATAITTTIVELSVQHKNYMIEILEKLQESGVVIVYNNTISNDLVRTTNSKID